MTRGERAVVRQYVSDMLEQTDIQVEIRSGRVNLITRQDLGDAETLIEEAWEWKAGRERGQQL